MPDILLLQFHQGRWSHGWWSSRAQVGRHKPHCYKHMRNESQFKVWYIRRPLQWLELEEDMRNGWVFGLSLNIWIYSFCLTGLIFCWKYNFALIEVQEHVNDLTNFEASLATDELAEWRKDIEAWEEDHSRPMKEHSLTAACAINL
jgi:hypothetical protein